MTAPVRATGTRRRSALHHFRRQKVVPNPRGPRHVILKKGLRRPAGRQKVPAEGRIPPRAVLRGGFVTLFRNWSEPRVAMVAGHRRPTGHLTSHGAADGLLHFILLVLSALAVAAVPFIGYAIWPSASD